MTTPALTPDDLAAENERLSERIASEVKRLSAAIDRLTRERDEYAAALTQCQDVSNRTAEKLAAAEREREIFRDVFTDARERAGVKPGEDLAVWCEQARVTIAAAESRAREAERQRDELRQSLEWNIAENCRLAAEARAKWDADRAAASSRLERVAALAEEWERAIATGLGLPEQRRMAKLHLAALRAALDKGEGTR